MKKIYILLLVMLFGINLLQAQSTEDYWVDVHFTRDSTTWLEAFPALQVVNFELSTMVDGEYQGSYFWGAFGRFAVAAYSYTPLNAENDQERFIYAFRMGNNATSQWVFPEVPNASKIKIHYICGNVSNPAEFTLQKYISGEGTEAIWEEFDPVIKFSIPPHANSTISFFEEKDLNIQTPTKLRLKGPTLRNVHLFTLTIAKHNAVSTFTENEMDRMHLNLIGRSLDIRNFDADFKASIYNFSGQSLGSFRKGESFTFPVTGPYLIRVESSGKTITKKIIVK